MATISQRTQVVEERRGVAPSARRLARDGVLPIVPAFSLATLTLTRGRRPGDGRRVAAGAEPGGGAQPAHRAVSSTRSTVGRSAGCAGEPDQVLAPTVRRCTSVRGVSAKRAELSTMGSTVIASDLIHRHAAITFRTGRTERRRRLLVMVGSASDRTRLSCGSWRLVCGSSCPASL